MPLQPYEWTAMNLGGTVALPAPYPATGSVSLLTTFDGGDLVFLVKIVQIVSARRIITRFIRYSDLRAVQAPGQDQAGTGPESWPILTVSQVGSSIESAISDLSNGTVTEVLWYPQAIVYVPEAAPVLHRNEVGVTAAVSCEEVCFAGAGSVSSGGCVCPRPSECVWGESSGCHCGSHLPIHCTPPMDRGCSVCGNPNSPSPTRAPGGSC